MKILNLCGYSWEIGGPAKVIYDHTNVQIQLGAEVTILTPLSEGERLYIIPEGAKVVTTKRHWLARFIPEFSPELYRYYRQHAHEYDIVHIHGPFHFAGWVPFWVRSKAKKVFTVHGTLDRWAMQKSGWKKQLISALFQRKYVAQCDLIQVHNPDEEEDLKRYLGHTHPHVVMINNGMLLSDYDQLPAKGIFRKKFGIAEQAPLILFLSRINVKKGLNLLLPAFQNLLKTYPEARLCITGPDDGYLSYVTDFIQKHQLSQQIILTGMLTGTDKLEAIVDADVFALPTYSESFSLAALEAMVCGTAVLTTDRIGFGHLLKQNHAAELVTHDVSDVERGLRRLIDDPVYRLQLAAKGQTFARDVADIKKVATRLYRAFESIL
ncbi:glycosyl transferase family 1 [Siphonobacter sp. BAB-5385]|uniref:glycosyltransferase n=1 Tax=Siphonobacter sp. BAB-5385 TaxID=1864822 RepID=UPI000B9E5109|nr:glycosyltransferase [Siphonobacter sp. BAB-5385]OZI05237.1 glycosyl transferase family 1 [Siphonobacter sp. BAB-5385]